jgi:hypothetical protein
MPARAGPLRPSTSPICAPGFADLRAGLGVADGAFQIWRDFRRLVLQPSVELGP